MKNIYMKNLPFLRVPTDFKAATHSLSLSSKWILVTSPEVLLCARWL